MRSTLVLIVLFCALGSFGQDIRGATLRFEHIGGYLYHATLHLYLETAISTERPFVLLDGTELEFIAAVEQSPSIHVEEFGGNIVLGPGFFLLTVTEPYFVDDILNIPNSGTTPLIFQYSVYMSPLGPNDLPTVIFDLNEDLTYDPDDGTYQFTPQIIDTEGDSLAFELVECPHVGYTIPGNAQVDASTGVLTGIPSEPGKYAYCIQVKERKDFGFGAWNEASTSYFTVVLEPSILQNKEELDRKVPPMMWYDAETTTLVMESKCSLAIHDMTGRKVFDRSNIDAASRIELSHLPPGAYLIHCSNEQGERSVLKIAK